jgi:hypothetical protein
MKTWIFVLFLFPAFCFAQEEKNKTNTPAKPSTTDCPTWNKKSKSSKAEYFKSLRSSKKDINQQTNSNSFNLSDSKIQSNSIPKKTKNSDKKIKASQTNEKSNIEKTIVLNSNNEKSSTVVSSKSRTSDSALKENKRASKKEEKKVSKKETSVNAGLSEDKKIKANNSDTTEINDKKIENPDNSKTENSKIKKKLERMSRKTTKVKKHSNAKCPSF